MDDAVSAPLAAARKLSSSRAAECMIPTSPAQTERSAQELLLLLLLLPSLSHLDVESRHKP
jgi:hypothetical protein